MYLNITFLCNLLLFRLLDNNNYEKNVMQITIMIFIINLNYQDH